MYLENIVIDAVDPKRLGRFWEAAVGAEQLTDEEEGYETRLAVEGGPVLDLCFPRVPEPRSPGAARLRLDVAGGRQDEVVERLLGLGAERLDIGQGDVPWVVLGDPEGNPFCVLEPREELAGTGPLAAFPLASADPERDAGFWSWLTGWSVVDGASVRSLRHSSGLGPFLELVPEQSPKGPVKNRLHLDVRLDPGEDPDEVGAAVAARGGQRFDPGWGELPWRSYTDPSGNELCVLPAPSS
jgi:hypothetical protein